MKQAIFSLFNRKKKNQDSVSSIQPEKAKNTWKWIATAFGSISSLSLLGFGIYTTKNIQKLFNCSFGEAAKKFFTGNWDTGLSQQVRQAEQDADRLRRRVTGAETAKTRAENDANQLKTRIRTAEAAQTIAENRVRSLTNELQTTEWAKRYAENRVRNLEDDLRIAQAAQRRAENEATQLRNSGGADVVDLTLQLTAAETAKTNAEKEVEELKDKIMAAKSRAWTANQDHVARLGQLRLELRESKMALRKSKKELKQLKETNLVENAEIIKARKEVDSKISARKLARQQFKDTIARTRQCRLEAERLDRDIKNIQEAPGKIPNLRNRVREAGIESEERLRREKDLQTAEAFNARRHQLPKLTTDWVNAKTAILKAEANELPVRGQMFRANEALIIAEEDAIRLRQKAIDRKENIPNEIPLNVRTSSEITELLNSDPEDFLEEILKFKEKTDQLRLLVRAEVPLESVTFGPSGAIYRFDSNTKIFAGDDLEDTIINHDFTISGAQSLGYQRIEQIPQNPEPIAVTRRRLELNSYIDTMKKQKLLPDNINKENFEADYERTVYGTHVNEDGSILEIDPYVSLAGFTWKKPEVVVP
jgi:hypothetical protein